MSKVQTFRLNDGNDIPAIGMGCWMGTPGGGQRVFDMCMNSLKFGYRHFDMASGYSNEEEVGKALKASGLPRSEFYVTTKLGNTAHHRVKEGFEESLQKLDCEYVDLYLMHWPQAVVTEGGQAAAKTLRPHESPTIIDTWKEMEKLLETGKVKSIGVSNFSIKTLDQLLPHCTVIPVTNQVELHPCLPWNDLKEYCDNKGILLTAYSPLGRPSPASAALFDDQVIQSISESLKVTPAQVVLAWGVQRGTVVIPKSENELRMAKNIQLPTLSDADMARIDGIHKKPGMHRSLLSYHADDGSVFGWTYNELGWNMKVGGQVIE